LGRELGLFVTTFDLLPSFPSTVPGLSRDPS